MSESVASGVFHQQSTTMMPMSIAEIAEAVSGRVYGAQPSATSMQQDSSQQIATSVTTDSRAAHEASLFVAIAGERVDGHDFAQQAVQRGAIAVMVEHLVEALAAPQILVADTVQALGKLAQHNIARRRALPQAFSVIAITGSVGKTTTKDLLNALLSACGATVAPVGSLNNDIGMPLTALRVNADTRFFIAEMGANHVGELAHLTALVPPDIAVELKVGVAHVGEFGSVERIAQAKSELVQGLAAGGVALLNADDERVAAMANIAHNMGREVAWFALRNETHKPLALTVSEAGIAMLEGREGIAFTLHDARTGEQAHVRMALPGLHNIMNALAASTVAHMQGMSVAAIAAALRKVRAISPHRMALQQVTRPYGTFTLLDDSFNANPDSLRAGVAALLAAQPLLHTERTSEQAAQSATTSTMPNIATPDNATTAPWRVAVLGVMLELGEESSAMHEQVAREAMLAGVDELIAVGSGSEAGHAQGAMSVQAMQQREEQALIDHMADAYVQGAREALSQQALQVHHAQSPSTRSGHGDYNAHSVHKAASLDEAEALIAEAVREHGAVVVLLKGSHASGLQTLADRLTSEKQSSEKQ